MGEKIRRFPQPAIPNIAEVMNEFLDDQELRLGPRTFVRYADIIEFFEACINKYGYQYLDKAERVLFKKLSEEGTGELCQIFGPEKLPEMAGEFLGHFMLRKAICDKGVFKASGTVIKKLALWLKRKGHISTEAAERMSKAGRWASSELPQIEAFETKMFHFLEKNPAPEASEGIEGLFLVKKIEKERIIFSLEVGEYYEEFSLFLPGEVTELCRPGWLLYLRLVKITSGWQIAATAGVNPLF